MIDDLKDRLKNSIRIFGGALNRGALDRIEHLEAKLAERQWRPIETDPIGKTQHDRILVGFQGQFGWMAFTAYPRGVDTSENGYAKPTHWAPIPAPPEAVNAS